MPRFFFFFVAFAQPPM